VPVLKADGDAKGVNHPFIVIDLGVLCPACVFLLLRDFSCSSMSKWDDTWFFFYLEPYTPLLNGSDHHSQLFLWWAQCQYIISIHKYILHIDICFVLKLLCQVIYKRAGRTPTIWMDWCFSNIDTVFAAPISFGSISRSFLNRRMWGTVLSEVDKEAKHWF